MRVYTELVYGHMVDKAAPGTSNHYRKCSPYPFAGEVAVQSPTNSVLLSLDGFRKVHVIFIGGPQRCCQWMVVGSHSSALPPALLCLSVSASCLPLVESLS